MDADSLYPNRKRRAGNPRSAGFDLPVQNSQIPFDAIAEPSPQENGGGKAGEDAQPPAGYRIVEPEPPAQDAETRKAGEESQPPVGYRVLEPEPAISKEGFTISELHASLEGSEGAGKDGTAGEARSPRPGFAAAWMELIRKFAQSPTRVYAAAGVGLGIVVGVVFAVVLWQTENPNGPYDLGVVTSSATGLKGHLYVRWKRQLEYRVRFEPSDASLQAGFAQAVADPPRPLSIAIQLNDAQGFALCTREIVLRYNQAAPAPSALSNPNSPAGQAAADTSTNRSLAQDLHALSDAQEAEREIGKDVFQNEIGPDGRIAAVSAEGKIPCSEKAYENTSSWGFTPDFPVLAEQSELLNRKREEEANAARSSAQLLMARRRAARKAAARLLPFSIEGDDIIVEFDASRGIVKTAGNQAFFLDRPGKAAFASVWQSDPVSIHYRCDRSGSCVLTHPGLGALHARMGR